MPADTYRIVKGIGRHLSASILRGGTFLLGMGVCAWVLAARSAELPWAEIGGLAALRFIMLFRSVVLRRDDKEQPLLSHTPGDMITVVTLLRDGPAAALAVSLLSAAAYALWRWRGGVSARYFADLFTLPMLAWFGGLLYFALGGHAVLRPAESALFYQQPRAVLLPLLAMLVVTLEFARRPHLAVAMRVVTGTPLRTMLADPLLTCFDYVEGLCGALLLVQWTAWGAGTLPWTVLMYETLLLAARAHFGQLDAKREAESDPLTGLASWRGIETYLDRQITRACDEPVTFAVLFLDADGLKAVNDRHGHAAGDALLSLIGECCRLHARASDLVGRRGGDEFLLILDGLERDEAEKVQERLQRAIADTLAVHPLFGAVAGASIGLSVFPADASDADTLIEIADQRMYADKRARRLARQLV